MERPGSCGDSPLPKSGGVFGEETQKEGVGLFTLPPGGSGGARGAAEAKKPQGARCFGGRRFGNTVRLNY
jgi:hypothetical protein